jgi:hypothetical protein
MQQRDRAHDVHATASIDRHRTLRAVSSDDTLNHAMHQCHVDAGRRLGDERANFSREPGPTTHPLSHPAVNPNSLDQHQHSVNPSDGRTDGRQPTVDSSNEYGGIIHG